MLRKFAAVPSDVRKGSAFPGNSEKCGGCAAASEAEPQGNLKKADGKAEPFRTSAGKARKIRLA
jgi:hypothetical protein